MLQMQATVCFDLAVTLFLAHQAFDELLLMKIGGRIIYMGPLGSRSGALIRYFEVGSPEFETSLGSAPMDETREVRFPRTR